MKVLHRHAVKAAGLLSLAAALPSVAAAQARGQQPGQDTPRLLVATFRADNDPKLGVESADAIRTRVQQETPVRQLWVLSRNDINNYLTSSGYKADSALSLSDLKELAKLMRADEILDGKATKTANGVKVEANLILPTDVSLQQPLPVVEAKNAGDAAKAIEKSLSEVRKSLADYKVCVNALRAQKYTEAATAARAVIAKYPNSSLGRMCLLSAYQYGKQPADSIIRVANDVLQVLPTSTIALGNLVDAYEQKGDTTKSVEALLKLSKLDPSVRPRAIQKLGSLGKPEVALPFVKEALTENPGDPQLLRMQWLLLLSNKQYKEAIAAGEEYVKADTAAANADYFTRMTAAAAADSQPQVASQIASRGVQKFPKDASLWALLAQTQRKSGQLEQAIASMRRAVEIDPKTENGWPLIIVTQLELKQPDSAFASARTAIAAGADKKMIGDILVVPMGAAAKTADSVKTRDAWINAFKVASGVDSLAPTPNSKYFKGLAAFQVGLDALQSINKSKSCADVKLAEDMWAEAQINMPMGAAAGDQQKQAAGTIMGAINQYSAAIPQAKKALKCQ